MVLEYIYVVRHGFRSNWVTDPRTGQTSSNIPSPTGIASDPALAAYGVDQAEQLSHKILTLDPPVDVVYSSPFYRCLQTLKPTVEKLETEGRLQGEKKMVRVDNGFGEFFGIARHDHPSPATIPVLSQHFTYLSQTHQPDIIPSTNGETIPNLHNRYAYALHNMIDALDQDPEGPKAALLCTHAAGMICIGRALTGNMPEDYTEDDFRCGTCCLSVFRRRTDKLAGDAQKESVKKWDKSQPDKIPEVNWKGKGVMGGWECEVNGDCSHLKNGEERHWGYHEKYSRVDYYQSDEYFQSLTKNKKQHANKDSDYQSSNSSASAVQADTESKQVENGVAK